MKRKIAFTLIELLVTISIIAILAAILLPGLKKANEITKKTFCLNNERQLGVSWQNYMSDYDGWIHPVLYGGKNWPDLFRSIGYISWKRELLVCPAVKPYADKITIPVPVVAGLNYISFYNTFTKNTQVKKPSTLYFLSSDVGRNNPLNPCVNSYMMYFGPQLNCVESNMEFFRHFGYHGGGISNINFFDGHCESKKNLSWQPYNIGNWKPYWSLTGD